MSRTEQKEQTRRRILAASARGFRTSGYSASGVDALAKHAGVTSGAFYTHFHSKNDAFQEAIALGLAELRDGVLHHQATHGRAWWGTFVRFYLGFKRTCNLGESCTMQTLSPEVARADPDARATFEAGFREVAAAVIAGPASPRAPRTLDDALAALSTLVGAVTLARAMGSPATSAAIGAAAEHALLGRTRR